MQEVRIEVRAMERNGSSGDSHNILRDKKSPLGAFLHTMREGEYVEVHDLRGRVIRYTHCGVVETLR